MRILNLRNKSIRKNKKGIFQAIAALMVFGIFLFAAAVFFVEVDAPMKNIINLTKDYVNSSQAQDSLTTLEGRYSGYMDGVFLLVFGVLWAAGLLIGYYNDQGGPLMVVFFILLVVALLAIGNFSDYWKDFTDDQTRVATRDSYPYTYWIFDNLLIVLLVVIASGVMVNHFKE